MKRVLAPSQAQCPESFEQGQAAAADCFDMVADDARAEGRAEERGHIAGWLLELGATDLAIKLLDYADDEGEGP